GAARGGRDVFELRPGGRRAGRAVRRARGRKAGRALPRLRPRARRLRARRAGLRPGAPSQGPPRAGPPRLRPPDSVADEVGGGNGPRVGGSLTLRPGPALVEPSAMTFTPLRVRSHGSLLCGVASPEALIERALALGYESLALTDRDNLYLA